MSKKRRNEQPATPLLEASQTDPPSCDSEKSRAKLRGKKLTVEESSAKLLDEFEAVRTATQEVVEQVSLRLTAQLAEASRRLAGNGGSDAPPRATSAKVTGTMLVTMRKLRLKPKRGRLKDLGRIERTLDKLLELTAPKS
jgi:hypothetical protein